MKELDWWPCLKIEFTHVRYVPKFHELARMLHITRMEHFVWHKLVRGANDFILTAYIANKRSNSNRHLVSLLISPEYVYHLSFSVSCLEQSRDRALKMVWYQNIISASQGVEDFWGVDRKIMRATYFCRANFI